jgi:pilus assembly protein CpaF
MDLQERLAGAGAVTESQPDLFAEVKNRVHLAVIGELGPRLFNTDMNPIVMRERVLGDIRLQLDREEELARADRERLAGEIADDILGHGPLERLLADETVTEIMVNGPYDIWVERRGQLHETTARFTDDSHLRRIINKMVAQVGRRIDESSPMVDARLPDGSRVNAIIPPLSLSGPLVTIRKFSKRRLDPTDLVRLGTMSSETVEFVQRCVVAELNTLVSGGTGSPSASASSRSRTPPSCGSTSATCCGSRRGRRTSRARARSRSASSSATRCACVPTGSSSARSATRRRWTCSRR